MKQEKGESLRAFMDRFSKVCMGIRNMMTEIAMHHLVSAVRPGRFTESLIKRPTKNMDELKNRATKFMQIEEHIDYHMIHQFEGADKGKEKEKDRGNKPTLGRFDCFRENQGPRFLSFTPLTLLRGRVLDEALQTKLIPTLKQSQTPRNADTSKHY